MGTALGAALVLLVSFGGIFDDTGVDTTQPNAATQPAVTTQPAATTQPAEMTEPAAPLDLVQRIRVNRDQFDSFWIKKKGMVVPLPARPDQPIYAVHTHYRPPEEYDCVAWVKALAPGGAVAINVPAGKNVYQLRLIKDKFEFLGGDGLPTGPLPGGPYRKDNHLILQVRHDSVTVYLNGALLASFDPTKLPSNTPETLWSPLDQPEIAVIGDATLLRIYHLAIGEVTGRGKQLSPGPITGSGNPAVTKTSPDAMPGGERITESAAPSDADPSIPPKVDEIKGLVVMEAGDGQFHGKAIDIISTTYATNSQAVKISTIGSLGDQMRISLNEANRLLSIHHPDLSSVTVQISFGDKYSPLDGGSAGGAFTVLLLSSAGDFEIDPDAAMTGDITVDGKIRAVGEVPAKVHGAALDNCRLVCIPGANVADIDDAIVMQGPAALWETQIFSADTLDDAIASMRKNHTPQMTQAMELFDDLKSKYADKPASALLATEAQDELNRIVSLAPNHVSAFDLLRLAHGRGPTHLGAVASVEQAFQAAGPSIASFATHTFDPSLASEDSTMQAMGALRKLNAVADPVAAPLVRALSAYVSSYRDWAITSGEGDPDGLKRATGALQQKADGVRAALIKVGSNSELIDKMMHK
jgi:hypothetical protein